MINFKPSGEESSVSLYTEATKLSPISKTKKEKVLKDYGIKAGWSKGKSDAAISKGAADAVLKKWKADQKKAADAAKKAAEAKNPTKTPPKVTQPTPKPTNLLSRSQAAAIARKYKIDPAKLFGYGVKGGAPGAWINTAPARYVWKNAQTFEDWLKRAIRYGTVPK